MKLFCRCDNEEILEALYTLFDEIQTLKGEIHQMAINQAQFDADEAAFITAVNNLITAFEAALAAAKNQGVDLTAEDQQIATAKAAVDAAVATLNPPAPGP